MILSEATDQNSLISSVEFIVLVNGFRWLICIYITCIVILIKYLNIRFEFTVLNTTSQQLIRKKEKLLAGLDSNLPFWLDIQIFSSS